MAGVTVACVTALATVVADLVTAVVIGLAIAGLYALKQLSDSARVEKVPLDTSDHTADEQALLNEHVVAFRLDGPLYFGVAHCFLLEVAEVSHVRVVILRLARVRTLDATGASVLGDTIRSLEGRGITVLLSGCKVGTLDARMWASIASCSARVAGCQAAGGGSRGIGHDKQR